MSAIYFWKDTKGEYGYLTSDFIVQFSDKERTYASLTQYLHYQMANIMPDIPDEDLKQQILSATNPKTLRQLGAKIQKDAEWWWQMQYTRILYQGVDMKFSQNPPLMSALLEIPKDTILVEAHPTEQIWDVKVVRANLLGKALMEFRDRHPKPV